MGFWTHIYIKFASLFCFSQVWFVFRETIFSENDSGDIAKTEENLNKDLQDQN